MSAILNLGEPRSTHAPVRRFKPQTASPAAGIRREAVVPKQSAWLLGWFTWYSRRYLRSHFHSLRVSRSGPPPQTAGMPLAIFSNHASWWDPLVCLVLRQEFFPRHRAFAPIDASALQRYALLRRLGFFGVEPGTLSGARNFLRTAETLLRRPRHLLALTPHGRFADSRERPVRFQPGLGHLAARLERARFVPMAAEYVFWEERLPEILVRFGEPVEVRSSSVTTRDAQAWTDLFEKSLASTQDILAKEAQRREPDDFRIILSGGAGQGGVYDWWRSCQARWSGRSFTKEHGRK